MTKLKIVTPEDVQKALATIMNCILDLEKAEKLSHAGQLAALANAWTSLRRQIFEENKHNDMENIEQRLEILERRDRERRKEPIVVNLEGK